MAERIVDVLEVVQIDEEERHPLTGLPGTLQDGLTAVFQPGAVEQVRQIIVHGQVPHQILGRLAFRDVSRRVV